MLDGIMNRDENEEVIPKKEGMFTASFGTTRIKPIVVWNYMFSGKMATHIISYWRILSILIQ